MVNKQPLCLDRTSYQIMLECLDTSCFLFTTANNIFQLLSNKAIISLSPFKDRSINIFNVQVSVYRKYILIYIQQDAMLNSLFISGNCSIRVVFPPIIRSAYNFIYSIWYLSNHNCYLPL